MPEPIEEVRVRLATDTAGFVSQVDSAVNRAVAKVGQIAKAADDVGQKLSGAGRTMTMALTVPIAAVSGAAFKMGADFGETLDHIVGLAGVAREQVNAWKEDIYDISRATAKGPGELAEALYFITSAGVKGAAAIETLDAAAHAAAAGLGETQVVADAVTSVLNAYGVQTISAAQATAILVATVREGKGEATDFAPAIGRVIPLASQLGVTFDQVGAALAAMTRTGLSADEAVTALRGIFTELVQGGGQSADVLAEVGLSSEMLQKQLREQGLLSVLRTLATAFKGNMTALSMYIGNVRALTGFMTVTGQDAAMVNGLFAALAATTEEDLNKAFQAVVEGPGFRMRQALNDIRVELVRLGDTIGPVIADALVPLLDKGSASVERMVTAFTKLPPEVQKGIMALALLAATIGPALMVFGSMASGAASLLRLLPLLVTGLGALGGPVGLAIAGLVALAGALVLVNMDAAGMPEWVREVQRYLTPFAEGLTGLKDAAVALGEGLVSAVKGLAGMVDLAPGLDGTTMAVVALTGALAGLMLALGPIGWALLGTGGLIFAIGLFRENVHNLPAPLLELRATLDNVALGFLNVAEAILNVMSLKFGPIDLTPWETAPDLAIEKVHELKNSINSDLADIQGAFDGLSGQHVADEVYRLTGVVVAFGDACVASVADYAALLGVTQEEAARRYAMEYGPAAKPETMSEELARRFGIGAYKAPAPAPVPGGGYGGGGTGAAAQKQAIAYTQTLDELTETLLGLGRAAGLTDEQLAGYPWTLELARRAAERLGLTTDDLLHIFSATGAGFGDFMRKLAASEALDSLREQAEAVTSALDELRSQFSELFGKPTREEAQIQYRLSQLRLQRAQAVAAGASDQAVAAIDKEIKEIEAVVDVRNAEKDVLRARLDLADQSLLTDAEQLSQGQTLIQRMADMSAAALPVIDLYRDQAEKMKEWADSLAILIYFIKVALPLPTAQVPAGTPAMQFGGIVPGPRGQPRLILAHGGEPVLPAGTPLSLAMPVNVTIQAGADWMEITRRAHAAVTEALHQARKGYYLRGAPLGSAIG